MSQNSKNNQKTPEQYLKDRFGIDENYLSRIKLKEVNDAVWINSNQDSFNHLEFETEGIRFLRKTKYGYKPTTYALQILNDEIAKSQVKVDRQELETLLNREMIQRKNIKSKGYVAIKHKSRVIGCGLYKDELVSTRIPKGRGNELKNFF